MPYGSVLQGEGVFQSRIVQQRGCKGEDHQRTVRVRFPRRDEEGEENHEGKPLQLVLVSDLVDRKNGRAHKGIGAQDKRPAEKSEVKTSVMPSIASCLRGY